MPQFRHAALRRALARAEIASPLRAAVVIFALAFLLRAGLVIVAGTYQAPEHSETMMIAMSLAQRSQFADAYGPGTGPTAHTMPLYPLLLSAVYRQWGVGPAGILAQQILSCLFAALVYGLLPWFACVCRLPRSVGLMAGFGGALVPVNFWSETKGSFEAPLAAISCVLLAAYTITWLEERRLTLRYALLGGWLWGMATLITASLLPFLAGSLALGAWRFRARRVLWCRHCGVLLAIFALILFPWAYRNHRVMGSYIWTRSNFGLELHLSNHAGAHADYTANLPSQLHMHPTVNAGARQRLTALGEAPFHERHKRLAEAWIAAHPGRFLALTGERLVLFWFPLMHRRWQTVLIDSLALAGLAGLLLWLRTRSLAALTILTLFATYPLVYYVIQAFPRYRYPLDWTFLVLASFLVCGVLHLTPDQPAVETAPAPCPVSGHRAPAEHGATIS